MLDRAPACRHAASLLGGGAGVHPAGSGDRPGIGVGVRQAWHPPAGEGLLYGLKPVLLAIVATAVISFGRVSAGDAARRPDRHRRGGRWGWLVGLHELLVLGLACAAHGHRGAWWERARAIGPARSGLGMLGLGERVTQADLPVLFAVFLKAGALLFGSRLRAARLSAWRPGRPTRLAHRPAAAGCGGGRAGDAGPLFTTATFIGYLLAGVPRRRGGDGGHLPAGVLRVGSDRVDTPGGCGSAADRRTAGRRERGAR